jgi:hypothetical protein
MDKQDEPSRSAGPPIGSIAYIDDHGRRLYADVRQINAEWKVRTDLTEEQLKRIETMYDIFRDVIDMSYNEYVLGFRAEIPVNAEREIRLWEHLGRVYQAEVEERPHMSSDDQRLLYAAIAVGSTSDSLGHLLSAYPQMKRLPDLERVFYRVRPS